MASSPDERLLDLAARHASESSFFLGSALMVYQTRLRLSDAGLARQLGLDLGQLRRLALCRRPDPAASGFRADVAQIARYAGAAKVRLAAILREVEAYEAFAEPSGPALLAARDAAGEDESPC